MHTQTTRRLIVTALLGLSLTAVQSPSLATARPGSDAGPTHVSVRQTPSAVPSTSGRILVKLRPTPPGLRSLALVAAGLPPAATAPVARGRMLGVRVAPSDSAETLAELRTDPLVEWAEPEYVRAPAGYVAPDDPAFSDPTTWTLGGVAYPHAKSWWLRDLGAAQVWSAGFADDPLAFPLRASGEEAPVAVIDTGFYLSHPDKGERIVGGYDFFESYSARDGFVTDDDVTPPPVNAPLCGVAVAGHGTSCAGQVAAATGNGTGIASIGYDGVCLVYKVAGVWTDGDPSQGFPRGSVTMFDGPIIEAIIAAADEGAKVINLSLGGPEPSLALQEATDYARSQGAVVLAAAGNDGTSSGVLYPAANEGVIGVGSYGLTSAGTRQRSSFTNRGEGLDLLAPGQGVFGLTKPDYDPDGSNTAYGAGYQFWTGTSMATPAAAGAMALLWRFVPGLTADELTDAVLGSAADAGPTGYDTGYGWGFLDLGAAYAELRSRYPYLQRTEATGPSLTNAQAPLVSWTPVAGTRVEYRVAVDGTPALTTAATSALVPMTHGRHVVEVQPVSEANWWDLSSSDAVYVDVDHEPPVVLGLEVVEGLARWSDTESGLPHATELQLDGAAPHAVDGDSFPLGTLAAGTHTVAVRETDAAGNTGAPATLVFVIAGPPGAPALPAPYEVSGRRTHIVTWTAGVGATNYQYKINGGQTRETSVPAATVSLEDGGNTLRVRARNPSGASQWAQTTITYRPTAPDAPAPTAPGSVSADRVLVSWTACEDADGYEWSLSGSPPHATDATQVTVHRLRPGPNAIAVRAVNEQGPSAWATVTVTYDAPPPGTDRIAGTDRYATCAAASAATFARARTIVVATGEDWPDALGASVLASAVDGPLLITSADRLPPAIASEIRRLHPPRAYVIGGPAAVSGEIVSALRELGVIDIRRVAGADRFGTAAAVAREAARLRGAPVDTAFVASGLSFPDALAASPVAAALGAPILLTDGPRVPNVTARALADLDVSRTVVLGGERAVGVSALAALPRPARVAGTDRFDTARAFAEWAYATYPQVSVAEVGLANGGGFPDALTGATYMAGRRGVMLLAPGRSLGPAAHAFLEAHGSETRLVHAFGGERSLSASTLAEAGSLVTP